LERKNLWAPWRIGYVQGLDDKPMYGKSEGLKRRDCFLCDIIARPDEDDRNLVLWRTKSSIILLNRYPYNNGHLLAAPLRHIQDLQEAGDEELLELTRLVRDSQKALSLVVKPHGFNVGMNFGRCAGAGVPGHLHIHIVPRWDGDTNFMSVCSDTDVISQSLEELLKLLKQAGEENNLPVL